MAKKLREVWGLWLAFSKKFWPGGYFSKLVVIFAAFVILALTLSYIVITTIINFFTSKLFRVLLAISYFMEQNEYFGWNLKPKSDMELLTDGIWILIVIVAFSSKKED